MRCDGFSRSLGTPGISRHRERPIRAEHAKALGTYGLGWLDELFGSVTA